MELLKGVADCPVAVYMEYISSPGKAGGGKLCQAVQTAITQRLVRFSFLAIHCLSSVVSDVSLLVNIVNILSRAGQLTYVNSDLCTLHAASVVHVLVITTLRGTTDTRLYTQCQLGCA